MLGASDDIRVIPEAHAQEHCLEVQLPYLTGREEAPPLAMPMLLEPELAAMAARVSWRNNGQEVFLSDLRQDDPGYDGAQFAVEYRRARLAGR